MNLKQNTKTRVIAFYLPQFHPIPENDKWWGAGYTEWTNVAKAKPLFRGHEQPKIPADLGFYDLRVPEVREQQAKLAKDAGIEGFCYWHYWFGNGKRLLERPFNEVLESGKPDFPFCLGWANHSWENKTWVPGKDNTLLIEQQYGGKEDYIAHFNAMLPAFKDERYIRVNGKPLFLIWDAEGIPSITEFKKCWNDLAKKHGFEGFHFTGFTFNSKNSDFLLKEGFDSISIDLIHDIFRDKKFVFKTISRIKRVLFKIPRLINYNDYISYFENSFTFKEMNIPVVIPNFDHSPRSGKLGVVLQKSTPEKFKKLLSKVIRKCPANVEGDKIILIKSWNEWGEGNYLEPDLKHGDKYIKSIREVLNNQE